MCCQIIIYLIIFLIYPSLLSFINLNNTLYKFLSVFLKKFFVFFSSFENDKKDLENTIEPGNPSILFFKYIFILPISSLDKYPPLYNILSLAKGNDFNLTPS